MIKYSENAVRNAVSYLADAAYEAAREHCPVRTGRLKNSITCAKSGNEAVIFTSVEYAAKVELGTGRQRPQPYLSRGIEKAAKIAGFIFREELFGNDRH